MLSLIMLRLSKSTKLEPHILTGEKNYGSSVAAVGIPAIALD